MMNLLGIYDEDKSEKFDFIRKLYDIMNSDNYEK